MTTPQTPANTTRRLTTLSRTDAGCPDHAPFMAASRSGSRHAFTGRSLMPVFGMARAAITALHIPNAAHTADAAPHASTLSP